MRDINFLNSIKPKVLNYAEIKTHKEFLIKASKKLGKFVCKDVVENKQCIDVYLDSKDFLEYCRIYNCLDFIENAKQKSLAKSKEHQHKVDGTSENKRNIAGNAGEVAVGYILNSSVFNPVISLSSQFAYPDVKSLGVGVKTVTYEGNGLDYNDDIIRVMYWLIYVDETYPEIFCVYFKDLNMVRVLGVCLPEDMRKYQCDDLVRSHSCLYKGSWYRQKTGCYAIFNLKFFRNKSELIKIRDEYKIIDSTLHENSRNKITREKNNHFI